nr:uncharacterized protein LOC111994377 [Quercus suber]
MKHLPSLNQVFSLITQEEKQRRVGSNAIAVESAALFSRGPNNSSNKGNYTNKPNGRRERPICSHCGILGHVVDKRYKIHGYPPRYKNKGKGHSANQVSMGSNLDHTDSMKELTTVALTSSQCHQLMSMLQAHTLGSQGNQDSPLETHQAATLISHTAPVTKSMPPGSFHTAGILPTPINDILDKPECLDSINSMSLCLHSSTNLEHLVFSSNLVIPPTLLPNEWIVDSGATNHMVHSISYLTKITSVAHISVKLPNGESVLVTHVGQVQLSCDLVLDNVLCVPSFSFNLISIGKLTHYLRCCCIFLSQFCFIQNLLQWKTIGLGRKHDGLYILQPTNSAKLFVPIQLSNFMPTVLSHPGVYSPSSVIADCSLVSCNNTTVSNSVLWHNRMGHPSSSRLHLISSTIPDVIFCDKELPVCTVCPLAKQKRLPFPNENNICSSIFDLVHCDIWGPFSVPSINGYKLFNLDTKAIFLSRDVVFHEHIFPFRSMDFHLNNASNSQPLSGGSLFPPPSFIFDDSPLEVSDTMIDTHTPNIFDLPISSPHAIPAHPITPNPTPVTLNSPAQLAQPAHFVQPAQPAPRKSSRPHKAPAYLQDFHCQLASTNPLPLPTTPFPIESVLSYDRLSTPHRVFTFALSICAEPKSYAEAARDPRW